MGKGMRTGTAPYLAAVAGGESPRTQLLRYVQTVLVQDARNAASNASQRIEDGHGVPEAE